MKKSAIRSLALIVCLMLPAIAWSEDKNSVKTDVRKRKMEKTETSPLGDIIVEHYETQTEKGEYEREIWLADKKNPKNRFLLFEHGRSAEVLFSPNQQWLVINNFFISNESDVLLYRKSDGLKYSEVKDTGIVEKVWSLCMTENKINKSFEILHLYAEALRWSEDSGTIMVRMWGDGMDGGKFYHIKSWLCVFDTVNKKTSMDLRLMNKNLFLPAK